MNRTPYELKQEEYAEDVRLTRPFMIFLVFVFALTYGYAVTSDPRLQQPPIFVLATALMVVHTLLHWFSALILQRSDRLWPYLLVQVMLIFTIALLTQSQSLTVALFLALVGESVGLAADWRQAIGGAVGLLLILIVWVVLIGGWTAVPGWLLVILPAGFFVVLYVLLFMRQVKAYDEARTLAAELEIANEQLAFYATQVESLTREGERQRMARELHDTLAQGLAGLVLQLEALEAYLEKGDVGEAAAIAGTAKGRARSTLADARRAIHDLREQDSMDLGTAVKLEAEQFSRATGIPCQVTAPAELAVSDAAREHVTRCVSEGLTNVARHAQANEASVSLRAQNGSLSVIVWDDGAGFDTVSSQQAGHYGLLGLRERARLAGGDLQIESAPGAGTTLTFNLPAQPGARDV